MSHWDGHKTTLRGNQSVSVTLEQDYKTGNANRPNQVNLAPANTIGAIAVNDLVLVNLKGRDVIRKVIAIEGNNVKITNDKGRITNLVSIDSIYGKVTSIS